MIDTKSFFSHLNASGVDFYSGVPDSLLKNFCAYLADHTDAKHHIIAANEGNALSLGIGYHLATNKIPLIYMQNSGLGNIVNPLISLADKEVYSIPMLLMIGWRGEPGVKDEPQHIKQGRITLNMLDVMEVQYEVLTPDMSDEVANKIINKAIRETKKTNSPYALVVKKNSFSEYKLKKELVDQYSVSREDAIKLLIDKIEDEAVVVSTTGVASRELFEYRDELSGGHKKDFLTVGGMGHANQVALSIAIQEPNRPVYCFDGDGALLMHMGSLAINASLKCRNFKHIVFNNGVHDSVGGQPTVAFDMDVTGIAASAGYDWTRSVSSVDDISSAIGELKEIHGTGFLEIRVNKGFRKNLGRPTTSPKENKKSMMDFISKC